MVKRMRLEAGVIEHGGALTNEANPVDGGITLVWDAGRAWPALPEPRRLGGTKQMRILSSLLVCGTALLAASCHSLKTASQPSGLPLRYHNAQYGLTFFLPAGWRGYSVLVQQWDAPLHSADYQSEVGRESGPIIVLRNPHWRVDDHYQDIPIMVFTRSQWADEEQQRFFPYACGLIGELWHNPKYVFGMWTRYEDLDIQNNSGAEVKGVGEARDIIKGNRAANDMPPLYPK